MCVTKILSQFCSLTQAVLPVTQSRKHRVKAACTLAERQGSHKRQLPGSRHASLLFCERRAVVVVALAHVLFQAAVTTDTGK